MIHDYTSRISCWISSSPEICTLHFACFYPPARTNPWAPPTSCLVRRPPETCALHCDWGLKRFVSLYRLMLRLQEQGEYYQLGQPMGKHYFGRLYLDEDRSNNKLESSVWSPSIICVPMLTSFQVGDFTYRYQGSANLYAILRR